MIAKSKKPIIPFVKAYKFIHKDRNLSAGEKLVMDAICTYWPNPCWQSNKTIAEACGFNKRYTERLIRRLKNKKYIKTGYAHTTKNGKPYTARVIVPVHFPKVDGYKIQWASSEQQTGQPADPPTGQSVQTDRPIGAKQTGQSADLLETDYKRNREAPPTPSPVERATAALNKKPPKTRLTAKEFEQRRQRAIKQLAGVK